ncbi:MAG: glycosyltransferase family 4 protein [Planctomycetaceae bacterium]
MTFARRGDAGPDGFPQATVSGRRRIVLVSRGLDEVGTGVQVELAASGLMASDWEVHAVILTSSGDLAMRLEAVGVRVHRVSHRPTITVGCLPAVMAILASLRPALVESWGWSTGWITTAAGNACGVPVACRVGTCPGDSWWRRRVLRSSKLILADSAVLADACRRHTRPESVLRVVPPAAPSPVAGVDRSSLAERLGLRPDRPWTLCVAPIEAAARLEHLLFAIDQMEIVLPDVEHVLVGRGSQWNRISRRQRVQEIGDRLHHFESLEAVRLLVPHVALAWQAGDVSLGGAILDAMVAGVPAVAVKSPSVSGLVHDDRNGFLVASDPASDLTRRAVQVLESPERSAAMGHEAWAVAEEYFSPMRSNAAHVEAIETLVAG